ncbi:hypothetical protein FisN_13Lh159 [Fistulifera solaris]|uniref:Uncharacterized protein n=1 Tax=Fistulifera solaris TaxID=1519565 RepID=A0A1Z5KMC5_FISSO|nr:hypothetical protein FisN_13Lh159 [Fistulifera solaris]|eukprot:GAX27275.1 hypothetical protein FisN_13Lh159 [Fistulifera solaris]
MAGTRVLIASAFLSQLLVLAGTAFYFGLCRSYDMSCIPFLPQHGRGALQKSPEVLATKLSFSRMAVTVLVPDHQLNMWQSSSVNKNTTIFWKGTSEETLQRLCFLQNNANVETLTEGVDMIVCISSLQTKARLYFASDGLLFFFPRPGNELVDWQYLYSHDAAARPNNLHFQFLVEKSQAENNHSTSLLWQQIQEWSSSYEHDWSQMMVNHRCSYRTSFTTVEWLPTAVQKGRLTNDDNNNNTLPEWRIPLSNVKDTLVTNVDTVMHETTVALYLPGRDLVTVGDNEEDDVWLVEEPNSYFLAVLTMHDNNSSENYQRFVTLLNTVMTRCWGIPPLGPTAPIDLARMPYDDRETALVLPHFYRKLSQQQQIRQAFTQVTEQLQISRQLLLESPRTMNIMEEMSSVWWKAYQLLEEARHDETNALGLLESAVSLLEVHLERNPTLSPPIDLSRDHYFGIFVPLLIPLLLPNLFGLFREIKRYRQCIKKKQESSATNKEKQD